MNIDNLVIAWNRSAENFAEPIFRALVSNKEIGNRVKFLDVRGGDYADFSAFASVRDDEDGNDCPIPAELRLQENELEKVMPNADVFYLSMPQNPRTRVPHKYLATDVMHFLEARRRLGKDTKSGSAIEPDLKKYLFGVRQLPWTKNARSSQDFVIDMLMRDWVSYNPKAKIPVDSWNGAKFRMDHFLADMLHGRGPELEKREENLALRFFSQLNPGAVNVVQVFSQYGRSDKPNAIPGDAQKSLRFRKEVNLSQLEADMYSHMFGVNRVITLEAHSPSQMACYINNGMEFINLDGSGSLLRALSMYKSTDFHNFVPIGPDKGSMEGCLTFAKKLYQLDAGYDGFVVIFDKIRDEHNSIKEVKIYKAFQYNPNGGEFEEIDIDDEEGLSRVENRLRGHQYPVQCVVVDDMIDTFGTAAATSDDLNSQFGCKIIACGYHGIFSDPAVHKINDLHSRGVIDTVFISDTIPHRDDREVPDRTWIRQYSVGHVFAQAIYRCFKNDMATGKYMPLGE